MVVVDSPGIGDEKDVSNIVFQYMPQAFAFIYVINSPNAGGLQTDRVNWPLLTIVIRKTTKQPFFTSILEVGHELPNARALEPQASHPSPFSSFPCSLRKVSVENLSRKKKDHLNVRPYFVNPRLGRKDRTTFYSIKQISFSPHSKADS